MIAITEKTADFSGGLFCIGSLAFEASRFRPCLQKGIAFAVGMCYHHIVNKLIPSSGQGASPYRWYSPRAARHDSVRFRSRQYSLDERRQNAQGSSVCSCVLDDCSGMCSFRSFLLRKGFAHRCLALNLVFGAFLLPTFAGIALMTCKAYLEKRRKTIESNLQGRVQVPTGGIAHEPQGRFGATPKPTVTVWMEEEGRRRERSILLQVPSRLWGVTHIPELFVCANRLRAIFVP